ncbi:hypothetical protein B0H10DRAFT_2438923 [Mycena sp. CBHHK59/15]|nr:hypothetical protein B0H10DRAFT_2438923 [Mycena sp. CBHHK59/15]
MKEEIGTQAWELKGATSASQMLSPKTPKQGIEWDPRRLLGTYECLVDGQPFMDALQHATTRLSKRYLEIFHTPTHLSKSNQEPSLRPTNPDERLDSATTDGVGVATTLKPDLAAGNDLKGLESETENLS